ncbi:hypothetical protein MMC14_004478 [Varicellaria rhodocarpa]|nr:hypothetical protein [Varicellaria rhodocarpa]
MDPPPPPPPHGATGGHKASSGLPPGKYDIFVIPPHSAGSGFIYLPSLQPHRNSFLAGVVCTLIAVAIWAIVFPVLREWFIALVSSGGMGAIVLLVGIGVVGWAWGRTQTETGRPAEGGGGGPSGTYANGSATGGSGTNAAGGMPGGMPGTSTGPSPDFGTRPPPNFNAPPPPNFSAPPPPNFNTPPPPNFNAQSPPNFNSQPPPSFSSPPPPGFNRPPSPQFSEPPSPNPGARPPPKPTWQRTNTSPPNTSSSSGTSGAKNAWEKAREETRKREEDRKRMEELRKKREDDEKERVKQRERDAREREVRERREKEAKERKEKEAKEKREKEMKELKERREREAKEWKEKELRERREREVKDAKEKAEKEAQERKEKVEQEKKAAQERGPSPPPPSDTTRSESARPPSPTKKHRQPTARTATDDASSYSFRPYDKTKRPVHKADSASSIYSESSYAASQSTARTTPPPSNRGPYHTKDPDKIVIKAVYSFNNTFMKLPIAQLVSGVGSVTDGLVLRITTEGLFIDDDVRGVPQREWDVKAWTMKLVEVWCPQLQDLRAMSGSIPASRTAARSAFFGYKGATKAPTAEEMDAFLAKMLVVCRNDCFRQSQSSGTSSRYSSSSLSQTRSNVSGSSQSGEYKGLHVLRASIRDQEGKRYVFVLQEEEGWKVAVGLQRLRRGTQVRAMGVSGLAVNETKDILGNMGWI